MYRTRNSRAPHNPICLTVLSLGMDIARVSELPPLGRSVKIQLMQGWHF